MGWIRIAQKKYEEAVSYLQTVLRVDPADGPANVLLANYYESKGTTSARFSTSKRSVGRMPNQPAVDLQLADLYGRVGRVPEGIARAKDVLNARTQVGAGPYRARHALSQERRSPIRHRDARRRHAPDPNSPDAHFALGSAYQQKGDTANAIIAYKRTIALSPMDPRAYNNVAYLYAAEGKNLDEALALAQKAQDLRPDSSEILDTLGFVHYQRREYQKAEPVLKRATDLAGSNATILYHLGMTYYKLGRRDEAASTLRRVLQLQETIPQAPEIRAVLSPSSGSNISQPQEAGPGRGHHHGEAYWIACYHSIKNFAALAAYAKLAGAGHPGRGRRFLARGMRRGPTGRHEPAQSDRVRQRQRRATAARDGPSHRLAKALGSGAERGIHASSKESDRARPESLPSEFSRASFHHKRTTSLQALADVRPARVRSRGPRDPGGWLLLFLLGVLLALPPVPTPSPRTRRGFPGSTARQRLTTTSFCYCIPHRCRAAAASRPPQALRNPAGLVTVCVGLIASE